MVTCYINCKIIATNVFILSTNVLSVSCSHVRVILSCSDTEVKYVTLINVNGHVNERMRICAFPYNLYQYVTSLVHCSSELYIVLSTRQNAHMRIPEERWKLLQRFSKCVVHTVVQKTIVKQYFI